MSLPRDFQDQIKKLLENLDTSSPRSPTKSSTFTNPLGLLRKNLFKDVSTLSVDKDDPINVPLNSKFWECRWIVCKEFLSSEDAKTDLSDEAKRKELRAKLQQKLRGITVSAEKAERQSQQFEGSVLVERGTVVAIYDTPDGSDEWVGFIHCKNRVLEFRKEHFQSDLPLPLRCDDKVSFLVQKTNQCAILPGSVRVTKYCHEMGPSASGMADSFLKQASCDLILNDKQASALFAKLLLENDALQSPQFIEDVLMVAIAFIVIRFPIGSEGERETNFLFSQFGLINSAYVNPMEQKQFLSFFKGSAYPNQLMQFCKEKINSNSEQTYEEDVDILMKAMFLLLAFLKEFPEEAHLADNVASMIIKELLAFTKFEYEVGMRLMHLLFLVVSAPPAVETWRNIPALLSVEEFHNRVREGMPPVAEVKATYRDIEEYFDTYYKLLREDAYRSLCYSVKRLNEGKLDQKADAIYKIRFVEVIPFRMGQFNLCRVEWKAMTDAVKQEGGENSLYLHEGNLFCVSASGKFDCEKPGDALFAVKVSEHPSEGCSKGILLKFLPADCNGISEVEAIEKLQMSRHDDNAVMVESPVFYRAYEPVLTALKAMNTQQFPFKSEVLNLEACPLDAGYLPTTGKTIDVSPFQSQTVAKSKLCCVSDVHEELKANSILDETQLQAVNLVLSCRLAIIQGPPGTGKTFLTVRIIQSLLNAQKRQTPIVIMAYKNRVLDQLVSKCTAFCGEGEIIRFGQLSEDYRQDEMLKACLLSKKLPPTGATTFPMRCLCKSVTGMWMDWKKTLKLLPDQITFSTCLELVPKKVVQIFFEVFCAHAIDVEALMENLDGPLRGHAEDLFEEMKRKYQESLQQDNSSVQTKSVTEYSGEEEAEDKHKEWDRMCDKEDRIFGDEDVEDLQIPIEETGPEMDDEIEKQIKEGTMESLKSFFTFLADQHKLAIARLKDALSQIEEVSQEAEAKYLHTKLRLLKDAKIVAMTTTKACIDHKLLHLLQPEMIVIEEAGGILEPNVIACLTPNTKQLILVGDYKQIGPTVISQELKCKKNSHKKNFSASLMERLVDPNSIQAGGAPRFPCVCLGTQSRMHPALLPLFEEEYAQTDGPAENMSLRTRPQILMSVARPQCMQFPFIWWNYSAEHCDGQECRRNGKIRNDLEAKMAASYCYWLYSEGFDPEHIAILSPYRAQVNKIKEELKCIAGRRLDEFAQSSVFTVDEFQGHERDIVILSLVRNNKQSRVGFLMDRTRQVVAVSRQKRALCIIGCYDHFKANSLSWKARIKKFSAHVSESLKIEGKEVQSPQDLMQLVTKRLRGCRQKPLYDEPPTLDESKCPKEVKSHENEPMGAQKHTVDKHSSGGNVYIQNVYFQDIHGNVQLGRVNQGQSTVEEKPEVGSKEKLLKRWKGQKLVRDRVWDGLKASVCLIEWEHTGTGFIGKKGGKHYLVSCWHVFEAEGTEIYSVNDILRVAKGCTLHFSYVDETNQPELCLEGSKFLQDEDPIGTKELDLVALSVKEEALKKLPDETQPVDLCAMQYIWNRYQQPEKSWKNYYVTIVGFPNGDPLTVSIGKIKGQKEPTNPYLLDHDADTEPSSSGSPVVVAEELHRNGNDDPTTELAVIAVHTQDSSKRPSNIATLLTPLVNMLK